MDRRAFVGGLLSALAGGPVALAAGGATLESGAPLSGDAAILAWAIRIHGEEVVSEEIAALLREPEGFTIRRLKTRLNRISRHRGRAKARAARREAHAGDEVLYRGPVYIDAAAWGQLVHRETRGLTVSGRRVEVGRTQTEWAVFGIRNPMPCGHHAVLRDEDLWGYAPDGDDYPISAIIHAEREPLVIPRGSRVLADFRNGRKPVMTAEIVRTGDGGCRVHLWSHSQPREEGSAEPVPSLDLATAQHGRVFETAPAEKSPLIPEGTLHV